MASSNFPWSCRVSPFSKWARASFIVLRLGFFWRASTAAGAASATTSAAMTARLIQGSSSGKWIQCGVVAADARLAAPLEHHLGGAVGAGGQLDARVAVARELEHEDRQAARARQRLLEWGLAQLDAVEGAVDVGARRARGDLERHRLGD